jgi:hypothetical protein
MNLERTKLSSLNLETWPRNRFLYSSRSFKPQISKLLLKKAKIHDLYMYMNALKLPDELTTIKLYLLYSGDEIPESSLIKDIKYGKFPKEHSFNISRRSKLQQYTLKSILDSLTFFLKCPNLPLGETLLIMKIKLLLSFTNRVKKDQNTSQYRRSLFYEKFEEELKGYIDKLEILHELPEIGAFLRKISMIFMSYLLIKSASMIVDLNG